MSVRGASGSPEALGRRDRGLVGFKNLRRPEMYTRTRENENGKRKKNRRAGTFLVAKPGCVHPLGRLQAWLEAFSRLWDVGLLSRWKLCPGELGTRKLPS
ncbi:hypothetical protein CDL15_Pgr017292 [Punica granatum]|uniref:Uncharacterized protein n=1 Tax=Punica granatum TaxID=22663 RepID=A0A218Y2D8_PUNGR|nr:hypothetical protein CDL15_Pgr017292 [Punica granatum]